MKERLPMRVDRRGLLGVMMTGVTAAAVASEVALEMTAAKSFPSADKRRARYQPNSTEVQEFYRVNRYPTR